MSSSTMIMQPESPSSHFIDDIEPEYDYALEDLDVDEPAAELIFDWDDTLLPSTWLNLKGLRLDYPEVIPEDVVQALAPHDAAVYKVLSRAMTYGNCVIITNAERGWVELSAARFMPKTESLLSQIKVISARTQYEPEYPDNPLEWKVHAFQEQLDECNRFMADGNEKNIISFGDSIHERDAVQQAGKWLPNAFIKSVKFVERPTLDQLQREVALLDKCLDHICSCRSNLDLMLTLEILYE